MLDVPLLCVHLPYTCHMVLSVVERQVYDPSHSPYR
jgi:hypothetical protein